MEKEKKLNAQAAITVDKQKKLKLKRHIITSTKMGLGLTGRGPLPKQKN
jgi:hypothetical protein